MPSVVLRYRGSSNELQLALSALGEEFERTWSPGDVRWKSEPLLGDFGFNLCLVSDHDISCAEAIEESMEALEELAGELAAVGQSLHGCTMDIGLFPSRDTFSMSTRLTAGQCAQFAALGVDFESTVYSPSDPKP
jgi:hypothetical protein